VDKIELQARTRAFAIAVLRFTPTLPASPEFLVIRNQLTRSATGIGANYRAACRGRSLKDFVSKLAIAVEEADESVYWLELLKDLGLNRPELKALIQEADQLTAILTASHKTANSRC